MIQKFYWGASTSAYQIEGAHLADGKGLSIWDVFSNKKGKILDGTNGNISCDHYNRYMEDIDIMNQMNLSAYRFSISWPRVMPVGRKEINQKGLDFYDKLVEQLLLKGITPFVTLYHFDLPYELSKRGGWYNRDTSEYFGEYAEAVVKRLGDRVKNWITVNEPLTITGMGYYVGSHAPGKRNILKGSGAVHNILLAHGKAVERIKAAAEDMRVGITNIIYPVHRCRERDVKAEKKADMVNRVFMDPIYKGEYPELGRLFVPDNKIIKEGDMKIISQPLDFLGLNIYSRIIVKNSLMPLGFKQIKPSYEGVRFTSMGWEIYPDAMYEAINWVKDNYGNPEIIIAENGSAFEDKLENGRIVDDERQEFLKKNIQSMGKAIKNGARVNGYFVWSLLDNFEWNHGLSKRFGLVYVDYASQERIIKESGLWYSSVCKDGEFKIEDKEIKNSSEDLKVKKTGDGSNDEDVA